jgi:hypothetical protein
MSGRWGEACTKVTEALGFHYVHSQSEMGWND